MGSIHMHTILILLSLSAFWGHAAEGYCDTLSAPEVWRPSAIVEYRLDGAWVGNAFRKEQRASLQEIERISPVLNYELLQQFQPTCRWGMDSLQYLTSTLGGSWSDSVAVQYSRVLASNRNSLTGYTYPYWVRFADDTLSSAITSGEILLEPDSLEPPRFRRWMVQGWRDADTVRIDSVSQSIFSWSPLPKSVVVMDSAAAVDYLLGSLTQDGDLTNAAIHLHLQILRIDYAPYDPGQVVAVRAPVTSLSKGYMERVGIQLRFVRPGSRDQRGWVVDARGAVRIRFVQRDGVAIIDTQRLRSGAHWVQYQDGTRLPLMGYDSNW